MLNEQYRRDIIDITNQYCNRFAEERQIRNYQITISLRSKALFLFSTEGGGGRNRHINRTALKLIERRTGRVLPGQVLANGRSVYEENGPARNDFESGPTFVYT